MRRVKIRSVFWHGELADEIGRRLTAAGEAVANIAAERILAAEAEVIDEIVDHYSLRPATADWDALFSDGVEEHPQGQLIRLFVPVTGGDDPVWSMRPSERFRSDIGVSLTEDGHLVFAVIGHSMDKEALDSRIATTRRRVEKMVEVSGNDITQATANLRSVVAQRTSQRKALLLKNQALGNSLDIPLRQAPAVKRIEVPVTRKVVRVAERQIATAAPSDPQMSQAIYEDVIRTIRTLGNSFERLPRTSRQFSEEELRDLILFILNSNYEGEVRGEIFNGEGKTDILLPWKDRNAFIGECKIWNGQKKFTDAIDQLLGYTVWRDTKAALIVFIKSGDATRTIFKADETLRAHKCFVEPGSSSEDAATRSNYRMHHVDDPDRIIHVALLPVVIRESGRAES